MSDPDRYASQQSSAWSYLADNFSDRALTERLTRSVRSDRLRERLGYTPTVYWERRYRGARTQTRDRAANRAPTRRSMSATSSRSGRLPV